MLKWIFRLLAIGGLTLIIGGLMAFFAEADWLMAFGIAIAAYLIVTTLFKGVLKQLLLIPFRAKGKVLRGAEATIHSVVPTEAPPQKNYGDDEFEEDDDEDFEDEPGSYYWIDVTITPPEGKNGTFSLWEPSELVLVDINAPSGVKALEEEEDPSSYVADEEIFDGEKFVEGGGKYPGPQRLRLLMSCPPELRNVKFRYYFEEFGSFTLPHSTPSRHGADGPIATDAAPAGRIEQIKQQLVDLEDRHGPESEELLPSLREAARLNGEARLWAEAQQLYERELFVLRALDTEGSFATAQALASASNNLAGTYFRQGKTQQAEEEALRALEIKRSRLGGGTWSLAASHENLGTLYETTGKGEDAVRQWSEAVTVKKKIFGASHPKVQILESRIKAIRTEMGLF